MKEIVILGSTGSIGTQTAEVVKDNPDMHICALAAKRNIDLLERQAREFKPEVVCVYDEDMASELKVRIKDLDVNVLCGMDGMVACAVLSQADIVVAAVVGMIGIRPVIEAIKAGKDIAFANKETLVTAGHIIMPMAEKYNINLLPVDSEHAAIFQCLQSGAHGEIEKILLTASGGPFRGKNTDELRNVSVEDALRHPNWSMGSKITIDSSTMANKGLEVIEAKWLFDVDIDSVEVIIQPQSIIHSMVEFCDGAVMAQLGAPDMKLPIQYALTYPNRRYLSGERIDFREISRITFEEPDGDTFRALKLAREAGKAGGSMPTVFNAANEKAVSMFLNRQIPYLKIYEIIEKCMEKHDNTDNPSLDDILEVERDVYSQIEEWEWRNI